MGHILFCISVSRTNIGKNGIDKKSATAGHFSRSTFFSTAVAGNSNFVLFTYTIFTTITYIMYFFKSENQILLFQSGFDPIHMIF